MTPWKCSISIHFDEAPFQFIEEGKGEVCDTAWHTSSRHIQTLYQFLVRLSFFLNSYFFDKTFSFLRERERERKDTESGWVGWLRQQSRVHAYSPRSMYLKSLTHESNITMETANFTKVSMTIYQKKKKKDNNPPPHLFFLLFSKVFKKRNHTPPLKIYLNSVSKYFSIKILSLRSMK